MTIRGLKIAMMMGLTAKAQLYHLAPAEHAESRQMCLSAVLALVGVAKTFQAHDYDAVVDPYLGVSPVRARAPRWG